ncbi:MAG: sulfur carrier protein ThiS adenylyltransferase ThiF [Deltaproteobacteria bacterium]|nr:sulfur carrier protein ThiS adenylyltransferase ThiF [Deltaproteobacteria bacterium]
MIIFLNEKPIAIDDKLTLFQLRDRFKPTADILVRNGFPASNDVVVEEADHITLIRRGEKPPAEELEALMIARHTPGVHKKLKASCVGIAGVGGLGSAIAVALGRIGVGRLILVDYDVVEPSNLNRQQFFIDQIGEPKTEAMKANLKRINPFVEVESHQVFVTPENIPDLFDQADVLAEAFDGADQKAMLIEEFLSRFPKIPLVAASGIAGYAPSNTITTRHATKNLYLVGDGKTAARPGEGLMAPRVGIAAHHQANAIIRLLLGEKPE